jgi:1-acyl-sn-glycerol-3-phosphate acyltransferases
MRTLLILIFLLLYSIFSIPCYLIEFVIGKINPRLKVKSSQAIVVTALKIILFLAGVKRTVIGLENIPEDEAVLYVANHRSYFDIVLGYATVPNLTGFVSKKELQKVPCISRWMRYINCLFLDRENAREGLKTVLQGIEQIKNGYSIFIMPEGTRNHGTELLPFHEGSFKFAEKSGCAIIPVAMNNTDNIFENHFPWIRKTNVVIEYGKPIYMKELDKEERKFIGAYVQKIISNTVEKNQTKL